MNLLSVEGVSKKFCRELGRSLRYAIADIGGELRLRARGDARLRAGEFWALREVSLRLDRGEALGILGVNGSGKSTLLKLLHGVLKPTSGEIIRRGTLQGLLDLNGAFNPLLSGKENILVAAALLGLSGREAKAKMGEMIAFAELAHCIDSPVWTYSGGMKARLGFSVATHMRTDILLIDEVLAVGDVAFQAKSLEALAAMRERAGAVIFVSHSLDQVQRLCNRCLVLNRGQIEYDGATTGAIDHYLRVTQPEGYRGNRPVITGGSGGIRLVDWEIVQRGVQVAGPLENAEFDVVFRIFIDEPVRGVALELGLYSEDDQPLISQGSDCPQLAGKIGLHVIRVRFPTLHLGGRRYFLRFALRDSRSLNKLLRFSDPRGFEVSGQARSRGLLDPGLDINVAPASL